MPTREVLSYCRICTALCGMVLTVDEEQNKIVNIRGDKDSPMSNGYVCFKGLQAEEAHHGPSRLLRPLKRQQDGSFAEIDSEQAIKEIAEKLHVILDRDGREAVAAFKGTAGTHAATNHMQDAFLAAIGSQQYFTVNTIDQSAKAVSFERQGGWGGGLQDLNQSEVILLIGANPLISHSTMPVFSPDPSRILKKAKSHGLKLICIDPRRTETAHHADLFLQPLPGRDAAIAAALIRIILQEGWEDKDFVEQHVGADRVADLENAVVPYKPEMVEQSADLQLGQIRAVAEMFARDCKTGAAYAATGPSMAPFSNLTQHLVDTLNIICGRFRRAGDKTVVDMVAPAQHFYAEVVPPMRSWEALPKSRIRGVGRIGVDRLTSTLAEEILKPGEGQIRSLFVLGANPAICVPDQNKIVEALKSLELLVVVDPYMTATAQLADYVLPPLMMFERPDIPWSYGGLSLLTKSWAGFAGPVLKPPPGSDLIDDWYLYWALASRLGLQIDYFGSMLDMESPPTTEDLLSIRMANSFISFEKLKEDTQNYPSGKLYDPPSAIVKEASPDANAKFDVMPTDVAEELNQLLGLPQRCEAGPGRGYTHLLSVRRNGDVMNSLGNTLAATLNRTPYNPAFINPQELDTLELEAGDKIEIVSEHGQIEAIVQPDKKLRRGVVSISHSWGGLSENSGPGVNVNLLISCDKNIEPINAMPRMSAIPVRIKYLGSEKKLQSSVSDLGM